MATNTSLLNLVKPATTESADITVINSNMDKIDGHQIHSLGSESLGTYSTVQAAAEAVLATGEKADVTYSGYLMVDNVGYFMYTMFRHSANNAVVFMMGYNGKAYICRKLSGSVGTVSEIAFVTSS